MLEYFKTITSLQNSLFAVVLLFLEKMHRIFEDCQFVNTQIMLKPFFCLLKKNEIYNVIFVH